jgi:DNA-binding beta-propeller fold protein YncE
MITQRGTQVLLLISSLVYQLSAIAEDSPRYTVDPSWPKPLPNGWSMGQASGVAVDHHDHIWVIQRPASACATAQTQAHRMMMTSKSCRPAPPVLKFNQEGHLLNSWGGPGDGYDWPEREHGLTIDPRGFVWIGGNGTNDGQYLKFTTEGHFVLQIGQSGPLTNSSDLTRLGQPADADIDIESREVYIADGYHNHRVIVFDSENGRYKRHWGAYGNTPTDMKIAQYNSVSPQFGNPVHCVRIARDGLVYICDRANNRIQIFTKDGTFIRQFVIAEDTKSSGSTWDLDLWIDPMQSALFHADGTNSKVRILRKNTGSVTSEFGRGGDKPGEFHRLHNLALDSAGNLYTTEVDTGNRAQKFRLVRR